MKRLTNKEIKNTLDKDVLAAAAEADAKTLGRRWNLEAGKLQDIVGILLGVPTPVLDAEVEVQVVTVPTEAVDIAPIAEPVVDTAPIVITETPMPTFMAYPEEVEIVPETPVITEEAILDHMNVAMVDMYIVGEEPTLEVMEEALEIGYKYPSVVAAYEKYSMDVLKWAPKVSSPHRGAQARKPDLVEHERFMGYIGNLRQLIGATTLRAWLEEVGLLILNMKGWGVSEYYHSRLQSLRKEAEREYGSQRLFHPDERFVAPAPEYKVQTKGSAVELISDAEYSALRAGAVKYPALPEGVFISGQNCPAVIEHLLSAVGATKLTIRGFRNANRNDRTRARWINFEGMDTWGAAWINTNQDLCIKFADRPNQVVSPAKGEDNKFYIRRNVLGATPRTQVEEVGAHRSEPIRSEYSSANLDW